MIFDYSLLHTQLSCRLHKDDYDTHSTLIPGALSKEGIRRPTRQGLALALLQRTSSKVSPFASAGPKGVDFSL